MNLNQITIPSIDLERSVQFYKKLGLQLIVDALPKYARFLCPDGDTSFSIHYVQEIRKGGGIILYFEVSDVSKTVKELKQKGITFTTKIIEQPWLWTEARLEDPDGNALIIFNAGKNRKNPPWRLKEND